MNTDKIQNKDSGKHDSKWLQINQMLVEMVNWNFLYRLKPTGNTNNFNTIATGLNLLAEELLLYFYNHDTVYQLDSTKYLLNSFFILNQQGIVLRATDEGCALLDRKSESVLNKPFSDLLAGNSKIHWAKNFTSLCISEKLDTMPKSLDFMGQDELVNTFLCRIHSYDEPTNSLKRILVNIIPMHKIKGLKVADHRIVMDPRTDLRKKMGKKLKYPINLTNSDIIRCREAKLIIINNLENDWLSINELANILSTNRQTLMTTFKEHFGITIKKFIILERLRLALHYISTSDLNMKTICNIVGFKNYPHFSKSFRELYNYPPKTYRQMVKAGQKP